MLDRRATATQWKEQSFFASWGTTKWIRYLTLRSLDRLCKKKRP